MLGSNFFVKFLEFFTTVRKDFHLTYQSKISVQLYLYLLHLYPGFYSFTEGATWTILDILTETLFVLPSITVSRSFG